MSRIEEEEQEEYLCPFRHQNRVIIISTTREKKSINIPSHGIRKTSIGIAMNRAICNQAQTFQKGYHCRSTKRTVQTNREWVAVLGRDIKSFRGLSGEITTTGIYNSTGKNDRKLTLMLFRPLFDRKESCFGIQSIKDRLHLQKMSKKKKIKYHQNINTTFNQGIHLFIIALHLMESRRKEV